MKGNTTTKAAPPYLEEQQKGKKPRHIRIPFNDTKAKEPRTNKSNPYKAKFEQCKKFHQAAKKEIRKKETEIRHLEKDLRGLMKDHSTLRLAAMRTILHARFRSGGKLKYNHLTYIQNEIFNELAELVWDEIMAFVNEENKGKFPFNSRNPRNAIFNATISVVF